MTLTNTLNSHRYKLIITVLLGCLCRGGIAQDLLFEHLNVEDSATLSGNHISSLFCDSERYLWVGSSTGGLNRYNPETGRFERITTSTGNLSNNMVSCIYEDKKENLWIGTENGLNRLLDKKDLVFQHYFHLGSGDCIADNRIRAVYEDYQGAIWIGTTNGLTKMETEGGKIRYENYRHDKNRPGSLSDSYITTIIEDRQQNLWIGTKNGGLNLYDRPADAFIHFNTGDDSGLISNNIRKIIADKNGVWSDRSSLQIAVLPPFWKTWWADGLYLLVASILFFVIRFFFLKAPLINAAENEVHQGDTGNRACFTVTPLKGEGHFNKQLVEDDLPPDTELVNATGMKRPAATKDEQFLHKLVGIVEEHLDDPEFGVGMLSKKAGMSPPVLYKKLKAVVDMSVNNFIKSIRLQKAAQLLQHKELKVYEVAYTVGYTDKKYFSKEFKKQFGKTPSKFMDEPGAAGSAIV